MSEQCYLTKMFYTAWKMCLPAADRAAYRGICRGPLSLGPLGDEEIDNTIF